MFRFLFFLTPLLAASTLTSPAGARIKLAALPVRERVEIQLNHGQYTLVEEERIVPLLKSTAATGNNMIDFSWSNASIDKNSIQFRPLAIRDGDQFGPLEVEEGDAEIRVVNVAYPPQENALVWEVFSTRACAAKVRVSYLIQNLTRTFSYRALADPNETSLTLRCFVTLHNYSGEDFGSAGVWAGFGPRFLKTVGQQQTLRMLLQRFEDVPITKTFNFDWYAHGPLNADQPFASPVLMHYELTNNASHRLGNFPLQPGKVRIFIDDGKGGQAFLGEDTAELTPLDDHMQLYLGQSRDIVCTRTIELNRRHIVRANLFHQEMILKYEIENFRDEPCTIEIKEQLNRVAREYGSDPHGNVGWEMGSQTSEHVRFDYDAGRAAPVLKVDLPGRPADGDGKVAKKIVLFHFTCKNLW